MKNEICIECKKRSIGIKKRSLCFVCYSKLYRQNKIQATPIRTDKNGLSVVTLNKYEHLGEFEFIKNYFNHNNWVAKPAQFNLKGFKYTPDFYDCEKNIFIEVTATRQAYYQNKNKYELFKQLFPFLAFEIRKPSGELLNEDEAIYPQLLKQP